MKACAKVVANLQMHVDIVVPKDMRDEDDEIWAGVGFGPNFYAQVAIIWHLSTLVEIKYSTVDE